MQDYVRKQFKGQVIDTNLEDAMANRIAKRVRRKLAKFLLDTNGD